MTGGGGPGVGAAPTAGTVAGAGGPGDGVAPMLGTVAGGGGPGVGASRIAGTVAGGGGPGFGVSPMLGTVRGGGLGVYPLATDATISSAAAPHETAFAVARTPMLAVDATRVPPSVAQRSPRRGTTLEF